MLDIINEKIFLTRGDTATITLEVTDETGDPYSPVEDDVFIFTLKRDYMNNEKLLTKTFDENMSISFSSDDTKNLNFGTYCYDVKRTNTNLNIVDTFICEGGFEVGRGTNK